MDIEKIGAYIKKLRLERNMSQKELAEKLSVTSQAISKWENGRGMPDIGLLNELSSIFNVKMEDIINGEEVIPQKKKNNLFIIIGVIVFTIALIILIFQISSKDDFKFNTLASDNDNFTIKGVMAYNKNKKSIYISEISYSEKEALEEKYVVAECILYETEGNTEKKISQCGDISNHKSFNKEEAKTLTNLLRNVEFNVDNYSCSCNSSHCNNLYLKVNAIDINNRTITYNIPLQIDNTCSK